MTSKINWEIVPSLHEIRVFISYPQTTTDEAFKVYEFQNKFNFEKFQCCAYFFERLTLHGRCKMLLHKD